jgi:hypothetical protein
MSSRSGKTECPCSCAAARCKSVSPGSRYKQFTSGLYVQCSTADYGAVSEDGRTEAIIKIVWNLMK